ncbi:MAG TPA: PAS domain-containing sensor histidine kinase, partial [Rhodospirillales bacterium]|nr:PAS domain-containing sensor histidine kinase [Rhodospirillales bacterium]
GSILLAFNRRHQDQGETLVAAFEHSQLGVFITDLPVQGNAPFRYANLAFENQFIDSAAVDLHKTNSLEALARLLEGGERSADELARLQIAADAGEEAHSDLPVRAEGGGLGWRRISVTPFELGNFKHGSKGQRAALWQSEDITVRYEIDSVRLREYDTLADYMDHLPVGYFSADDEGRIIYANKVLMDWLGLAAGAFAAADIFFADFVVAAIGDNGGRSSDSHQNGDVTLRSKDGNLFSACLLQSGHMDDEQELLYSRSVLIRGVAWSDDTVADGPATGHLSWLFNDAPVGIVLLDLHGEVTDANRAFLKLLGVHRDGVVGRPFTDRINKEDRGDVTAQLSKVVMGIMPATHLEVRLPAMGERELVASLYGSRVVDNGGEISGLVLHFIDSTEQKNLEVQFSQSQKMQAIGQLAGGVAHDFNNLLTAMIGFSDLLLGRHGPEDPSFADIMQIKQNANRGTNLVRQLLAFSRQQTLEPTILDVADALGDLSHLLSRLIGENIELVITHQRHLGLLKVDRGQFDQVVINLAVNSRDAMPGGGTLTITTANVQIDAAVQRGHEVMNAGTYVLIEIADSGVGIAQDALPRIFEPFFSTKDVGAGTGLGLSTVYGIVHQTNGYIFVDSAPGEGTTFSIYLPRFGDDATAAPSAPSPGASGAAESDLTGDGTVLLVEDEEAVRMFGARALRNKGYNVLEAVDGEQALDVLNGNDGKVDLIISDVVMPGMDGHTLVNLVRHEIPDIKIILMSGYSEDVFADDVEADPGIAFLAKPFSLKDLAGKVKEVMEG